MIVHGHPMGLAEQRDGIYGLGAILRLSRNGWNTDRPWGDGWDVECYGRSDRYFEDSYQFVRWAEQADADLFNKHHHLIENYREALQKLPNYPAHWK